MDFAGIGLISYEAPDEDLRPFFVRKYRTWFKVFARGEKIAKWETFLNSVEAEIQDLPEDQKEVRRKKLIFLWDYLLTFDGKPMVTEDEFVDNWVDGRVFADLQTRKHHIEISMVQAEVHFRKIDLDKNGYVDLDEWCKGSPEMGEEIATILFNVIDTSGDGKLSMEEWKYAVLYFHFSSGPDHPLSQLFGPVVTEDK